MGKKEEGQIMPKIYEEELEEYILNSFENEENLFDLQPELVISQVNLGNYGIADIILVDFNPILNLPNRVTEVIFTVIELKKGEINLSAIAQISRYKQGVYNYFERDNRFTTTINGILIGDSIDYDSCFVIDSTKWLNYIKYNISIDKGISFDESCYDWKIKNNNYGCIDKLIQQYKQIFLDKHKSFLRYTYRNYNS